MTRKRCVPFLALTMLAGLSFWLALAPLPPHSPLVWGGDSFHSGLSPYLLLLFLPIGATAVASSWWWLTKGLGPGVTSWDIDELVLFFLAAGAFSAAVAGAILNRLLAVNYAFGVAMVVAPALVVAGSLFVAWSEADEMTKNTLTSTAGALLFMIAVAAQGLVLLGASRRSLGDHVLPWLLAVPRFIGFLAAGYFLFQAVRHLVGTRPRLVAAVLIVTGTLTLLSCLYRGKEVLDRDELEAAAVNRLVDALEASSSSLSPNSREEHGAGLLEKVRKCQDFQPRVQDRAAGAISLYLDRHQEDEVDPEADTRLLVVTRKALPGHDFAPQAEGLVARWLCQADAAAGAGEFDRALRLFDFAQMEGGLTLPEPKRQQYLQGWFRKSVQEAFPEFAKLPVGAASMVWERLIESRRTAKELYVAASAASVLVAQDGSLRARKHE